MKLESVPVPVRYLAVALLFTICGAWTATHLLTSGWWVFPDQIRKMAAVPFALLCAILCIRTWRFICAVPLMVVVWYISARAGDFVGFFLADHIPFLPGCVGGFIGGLGLVLSLATCYGRLLSLKYLLRAAAVGTASALPFAFWTVAYAPLNSIHRDVFPLLVPAFAIWQAVVGTYLYAICTKVNEKIPSEESATAI